MSYSVQSGDTRSHMQSLRESSLCKSLDETAIRELDEIGSCIDVKAGNYLFEEEDPADYVYNMNSGLGLLERLSSDGRRQIMAFLFPGDFAGLLPDPISSISAKALENLTAYRWHIKDLEALMERHPELQYRLRRIGGRVLATTLDQVFVLGCKNAKEKLAYFLLHMEKRQFAALGRRKTLHLPMTRVDIADYLGITVETVSRVFSKVKREGLIELPDPNNVIIAQRERLQDIAEYYPDGY